MKLYKKIDIYFYGDYVCSTMQSKTCKEALSKYMERLTNSKHSFCGLTLTQERIVKYPQGLKASFSN